MIILEANQSLLFGGIPLTDWLQAIGAIVAIVGVIYGYLQYLKDSKEKQSQIDTLTLLATESKTANQLLESQINEDRRIRKLSIRPRFTISFNDKERASNTVYYTITNIGAEAQDIKVKNTSNSCAKAYINGRSYINIIQKGETAKLILILNNNKNEEYSTHYFDIDAIFFYCDIDNNIYSQSITGTHLESTLKCIILQITDPIALKSNPDEQES